MVLSCRKDVSLILKANNNSTDVQNTINLSERFQNIGTNQSPRKHHFFENYAPSELTDSYRILSTPSSFAKDTLFYIPLIPGTPNYEKAKNHHKALI